MSNQLHVIKYDDKVIFSDTRYIITKKEVQGYHVIGWTEISWVKLVHLILYSRMSYASLRTIKKYLITEIINYNQYI